jgi:hypothetical protein
MMRQRFCRRPEVESLESMVLLSGLSIAQRPGAAALVAHEAQTSSPVQISGTAKGTYAAGRAVGAPVHFSAKGSLTPVGRATLTGTLQLATASPSGTLTISVKKQGKVFASLTTAGLGSPVFYTITGGTGTLAGESGSGEALVTTVPTGRGRGRFTIDFVVAPT